MVNDIMNYSFPAIATAVAASTVIIALNVFLCTRKRPIFSFVLPFFSFFLSILLIILGFSKIDSGSFSESIAALVKFFFLFNIPTVILILTSVLTRFFYKKL